MLIGFNCLSPGSGQAAVRQWGGGVLGDGEFTDPDSWLDAVPTNNTTSDTAAFFGFFGGPWYTSVNLSVERSMKGLLFAAPVSFGSPVNFTFTGSKLTIGEEGIAYFGGAGSLQTINNPVGLAAYQSWDINANDMSGVYTLRVNGPLSGSGELIKFGNGVLNLTASNTNTGAISVVDGYLQLTGNGRLSDKSNVEVYSPGVLWLDGMTDAINGLFGDGEVSLTDGATLVVGNSINNSEGTGRFFGEIRGTGGKLIKRGPGTFLLGEPSSYTGGTRVESGVLVVENSTGSATGTGGVEVVSGGRLAGGGRISGLVTAYSGAVIAPGLIEASVIAEGSMLNVGRFDLRSGATLEIELGGKLPGENTDTLTTTGAATIAGNLNVSLVPGFSPDYGDVFEILTAGLPIVGTFAGLPQGALVGNFAGTDIYIDYLADGGNVVLLRASRLGDFNLDGAVDAADYVVWRKTDGTLQGYDNWRTNFGHPGSSSSGDSENAAVPEPTTVVILILAAVGLRLHFRTALKVPSNH